MSLLISALLSVYCTKSKKMPERKFNHNKSAFLSLAAAPGGYSKKYPNCGNAKTFAARKFNLLKIVTF